MPDPRIHALLADVQAEAAARAEAIGSATSGFTSTYEIWLVDNPGGTVEEFLETLRGPEGPGGADTELREEVATRTALRHRRLDGGTDEPGPYVVWSLDDGYVDTPEFFSLLDGRGITGTLFLTRNWVDRAGTHPTWGVGYITRSQVEAIVAAGHEIGTHGVNHESYTNYLAANGPDALEAHLRGAVTYFESEFGVTVRTGAYCAGQTNGRVMEVMGRLHEFYRSSRGMVVRGAPDPYDVPSIDAQSLSAATIIARINEAAAARSPVVFLVHGGLTPTQLANLAAGMDHAATAGIPQGSFYDCMRQRTMIRSNRAMVDSSGNDYGVNRYGKRFEVGRRPYQLGDWFAFDWDDTTSAPYYDSSSARDFEWRRGIRALAGLNVGRRTVYGDAAVTNGSPSVTSPTAGFDLSDVGVTIAGTGIPSGTTIVAVASPTTATMSAAATATTTPVQITLGRPTAGRFLNVAGDAMFYGNTRLFGTSQPSLQFRLIGDPNVNQGTISATTWARTGTGGSMTVNTGTGGHTFDVIAGRVRFIDHTGQRRIALAASQPTDGSIANSEVVLYFDAASGTVRYRGKTPAGDVVQQTLATV